MTSSISGVTFTYGGTSTGTKQPLEPGKRTLVVPLDGIEWRSAGDPSSNETTLRGHAAVFNSMSEDLGGFREIIEPGFFRAALRKSPDVRLLFNHDPNYVMARTASQTLDLREDQRGLHVFAAVDKRISWTKDLRTSMLRGDIDQMSFAFTIGEGGDDWAVAEDGTVVRTLRADGADQLFDVSVVTYPAYRATEVSMRSVLDDAIERGRITIPAELREEEVSPEDDGPAVTPEDPAGESEATDVAPEEPVGESDTTGVAQAEPAGEPETNALNTLRTDSRDAVKAEKTAYLRLLREMSK